MRFHLRTLLAQFTIRDLLWLTAVIALIVVWRSDLAWQAVEFHDMLRFRMGNSSDVRIILHVAKDHPELLTELNACEAANNKNLSERASVLRRFSKLENKARDLYRHDASNDPETFFDEDKPAAAPFANVPLSRVNK